MADTEDTELSRLAKFVLAIVVVLTIVGVLQHGINLATIQRVLRQLAERPGGPMTFRFILQPVMAAIAAIHDGRRDARLGRSPYLRTMLFEPQHSMARLREGFNMTARIILLALVMDAVYQIIVLDRFYPSEAVIVAFVLAFVPYVIFRGIVLRIARKWRGDASPHQI